MIGTMATGAKCNRFLAGLGRLVVAAQECPGVSPDHVGIAALRVRQQGAIYTEHVHALHLIRMVILRVGAITDYLVLKLH